MRISAFSVRGAWPQDRERFLIYIWAAVPMNVEIVKVAETPRRDRPAIRCSKITYQYIDSLESIA